MVMLACGSPPPQQAARPQRARPSPPKMRSRSCAHWAAVPRMGTRGIVGTPPLLPGAARGGAWCARLRPSAAHCSGSGSATASGALPTAREHHPVATGAGPCPQRPRCIERRTAHEEETHSRRNQPKRRPPKGGRQPPRRRAGEGQPLKEAGAKGRGQQRPARWREDEEQETKRKGRKGEEKRRREDGRGGRKSGQEEKTERGRKKEENGKERKRGKRKAWEREGERKWKRRREEREEVEVDKVSVVGVTPGACQRAPKTICGAQDLRPQP